MSRCVRFPPPRFVWNGASGEHLIELLQARREKVAAEKRRKEKKRKREEEKKRRKKRKKKEEELEEGEIREEKSSKHEHRKHKKSKKCDDYNKLALEVERSNLTEEHEQPIGDHHSLYDSTASTEKARPKFATQDQFGLPAGTSTTPVDVKAQSSLQYMESQYRDLFVNIAAPFPAQTEHFHDQGWLFERRPPRRNPPACHENDSCLERSSLCPCLQHLPQAGIYALPYTIWF